MRTVPALLAVGVAAAIAGCGSSHRSTSSSASGSRPVASSSATSSATKSSATTSSGVNPNAPETLPPGDIPDTIAYVPYAVPGHGLTLSTPEGWSRKRTPDGVIFTDKLNTVQLDTHASRPITVSSARQTEVPKLARTLKGFKLQSISVVSRPAGQAVRIKYLGYSAPDPVTGKFGVLAFERFEFLHRGRVVSLVLSSPRGSDNVDPWRNVTSSLRFTK